MRANLKNFVEAHRQWHRESEKIKWTDRLTHPSRYIYFLHNSETCGDDDDDEDEGNDDENDEGNDNDDETLWIFH